MQASGDPQLGVTHGTTIVAIKYADGVIMAGDRRATEGYSIAHRAIEKVFPADRYSGVSIAGAAGPAAPAMETPEWRSAGKTFSMARWAML